MKNWLVFEQQRDAYILDGVSRSQAIRLAKKDCRNNPYEKYIKEREAQDLRDMEIVMGARKRNKWAKSKTAYRLKNRIYCYKDILGMTFLAFVLILVVAWGLFVNTSIAYCGWNFILNPVFDVNVITFKEAVSIGVVLLLICETLKSFLKSKTS